MIDVRERVPASSMPSKHGGRTGDVWGYLFVSGMSGVNRGVQPIWHLAEGKHTLSIKHNLSSLKGMG